MSIRSITPWSSCSRADRDLGGHHVLAEGLLERVERAEEVGALAVEHVHEDDAREAELGGALPEPARW